MTTDPTSNEAAGRSQLTSDEMLENYQDSVRFELDKVERMQGSPLAAICALFKIRYDAVTSVMSYLAQGPGLPAPFPSYEAIDAANAMLKPLRRTVLEEAARTCQPPDFQSLQQRAETIDKILDGLEAHIGGRMLRSPGFPSWIGLREAFHSELERFELWTLNIDNPPPQRRLSNRERQILACLSNQPIIAKTIAQRIRTTEGSVRNIMAKLKTPFNIHTQRGVGYFIDPDNERIREALSANTHVNEVTMA